MAEISTSAHLLKKLYRLYSARIIHLLQLRGFNDLRGSFLEILQYVSNNQAPKIKDIGDACGLKKQTMTSHLRELETRGYIVKKTGEIDKRQQRIHLTKFGEKFRVNLFEVLDIVNGEYRDLLGSVELDRLDLILSSTYDKLQSLHEDSSEELD